MLAILRHTLGRFDWWLISAALVLLAIGVTAVWSVALSLDPIDWGTVTKQLVAAGVGLVLFIALAVAHFRMLQSYVYWITGLSAFLLVLVLIFGQTIRGTTGWFSVAGWSFQPVEVAKFGLIIFLASYFSKHPRASFGSREFLVSSMTAGGLVALVLLQPDLGSASVLLAVWLGMLAVSRIRKRYLLGLVATLAVCGTVAWFLLAPYQQDRLLIFIDPGRDPLGRGYNVTQAKIAVGAGGLFGRGLGLGSQSQLRFLPEGRTDFIFAVIAEELGFFGVAMVLAAFGVLLWRILRLAKTAADDFPAFLAVGILLLFVVQFAVNVGMNLGLLPVVGIGLPLLSYGGSALIVFLALLGVAESLVAHRV